MIAGICDKCGKETTNLRRFPQSEQSLCPTCLAEMRDFFEVPEEERT
ncbi:MAG: hypothetical protein L3K16_06630 [Thermoplasmata archaeon]|nr:hypothetical protein [Thermoplasmata archaeon]